tara:strand:- start:1464 stop:2306 length:843 start_codon:yes stop_codon:yes gene_type:complete
MILNKYPDGTSYVALNDYYTSDWITFKVNTYEYLHHLEQFVEAYNFKFKTQPFILIPNLIDAQADRRFGGNQSSGLKIVLKRLNSMSANFKIFHPHNAEIVEALMDNVEIIDNREFISKVLDLISDDIYAKMVGGNSKEDKLILMSSDAGGFKPLMKLSDQLNWQGETYSASKARTKDGIKQLIDRKDFGGKDILIVDDISVYGGTFKGLSKLLKQRNCGKLYLAVSHMTVQNLGENPITNYFDKVFTTNSKFDYYNTTNEKSFYQTNNQPSNLEIIKLF